MNYKRFSDLTFMDAFVLPEFVRVKEGNSLPGKWNANKELVLNKIR